MGIYLNPGNIDFYRAVRSEIYVDKSGLINYTNRILDTEQKFLCVSRPRRFGKSMAANMLSAYYSRGCDSAELFRELEAAKNPDFEEHRNRYNVVHINMQNFLTETDSMADMIHLISRSILFDMLEEFPDVRYFDDSKLVRSLSDVFVQTGIPFVFVIDEWDCIFRVHRNDSGAQKEYLDFLRLLLKDQSYVALAYMTGILPIKKYGEHSALNMFTPITMTNPLTCAEFAGFTENEVERLAGQYHVSLDEVRRWYDGYNLLGISIYNPRSVVMAMTSGIFDSYWTQTETYEALKVYIQMDYDGLRERVGHLIAGESIPVNVAKFQNDMTTFRSADDVLTLLIHLGYLTYDFYEKCCYIPNSEVRQEFVNCIEDGGYPYVAEAVRDSTELLRLTIAGDEEEVAKRLEKIHDENSSILRYNDETSLSYAVALAYYAAQDHYAVYREMPGGKGFADLVYVPDGVSGAPAMIVELKWNHSAETALDQIRKQEYAECLKQYNGEILLVGISYEKDPKKDGKKHTCRIERIIKIQKNSYIK